MRLRHGTTLRFSLISMIFFLFNLNPSKAAPRELSLGALMFVKGSEVLSETDPSLKCVEKILKDKGMDLKISTVPFPGETFETNFKEKKFDIVRLQTIAYQHYHLDKEYDPLVVELKGGKVNRPIVFMASPNSGLKSIEDVKNFSGENKKSILFPGLITPAYYGGVSYLLSHGLTRDNFKKIEFMKKIRADTTMAALASGEFDIAAARRNEAEAYKDKGGVILEEFGGLIIGWVIRKDVGKQIKTELQKALIGLKDPACFSKISDQFAEFSPEIIKTTLDYFESVKRFEGK